MFTDFVKIATSTEQVEKRKEAFTLGFGDERFDGAAVLGRVSFFLRCLSSLEI